jgi:thiosulfate dehydrogenase [quinone] large subunit
MTALTPSRAIGILALRLAVGWVFLYAGLEKIFGAEPFSAAGFLQFGTAGTAAGAAEGAIVNPTQSFWVGLASNAALMDVINVLVPFGQVAIGAALILGLATRFAGAMGFLMMAFITVAAWDFAFGVLNYTSLLALTSLILGVIAAGEVYGVDAIIDKWPFVKRTPAVRYLLA